jgi:hypothetical protein
MPLLVAAAKLAEIGESIPIEGLAGDGDPQTYGLRDIFRPCRNTAHVFGHIEPATGHGALPIRNACEIDPDTSLRKSRIKLSLGRLHVADYPGSGTHVVLFDFYGRHQTAKQSTDLHYNLLVRATEGQSAPVLNYPIFVGLNVGAEGVQFQCYTVNVRNEDDEALLKFLESDVFQNGLKLLKVAQPALAPLSSMAYGLTRGLAKRNRNVPVQEFKLGLDFTRRPFGACLREGAYLAVQVPAEMQAVWDWSEWNYDQTAAEIRPTARPGATLAHNYVAFTVSRFDEE